MKLLPFLLASLCAGCAQPIDMRADDTSHIERVLQDVAAMVDGMAQAHSASRVVLRGPDFRSSSPRAPE